jgi:hypothetical protein
MKLPTINKPTDLIKICKGVHLNYEYPPYTLMLGFKDCTKHVEFEDLDEIEFYIKIVSKLRDMIKNETL